MSSRKQFVFSTKTRGFGVQIHQRCYIRVTSLALDEPVGLRLRFRTEKVCAKPSSSSPPPRQVVHRQRGGESAAAEGAMAMARACRRMHSMHVCMWG